MEENKSYAGFWVRWVASIIDRVICGVVGIIVIFAIAFENGLGGNAGKNPIGSIIVVLLTWCYYIFMTHEYGATLGKKVMGLKVISEDGGKLSLGKIIIRETIGKIVSAIILMIGYIMAAFTQKKQALHDKMAGSVVVHADPNKKTNGAAIAVAVIITVLVMIAVIGILSSVVLVSLSSARSKSHEAAVKANVASIIPQALLYSDAHGNSFTGFKYTPTQYSSSIDACSGAPVIAVSPNGQELAVYGKSCEQENIYYCTDAKNMAIVTVDKAYVDAKHSTCTEK